MRGDHSQYASEWQALISATRGITGFEVSGSVPLMGGAHSLVRLTCADGVMRCMSFFWMDGVLVGTEVLGEYSGGYFLAAPVARQTDGNLCAFDLGRGLLVQLTRPADRVLTLAGSGRRFTLRFDRPR